MCLALDKSQPLPWGISHLAKWVWIHLAKSPGDQGMLHRDLSSLGEAFQPEEQHVPSIATRLYPKTQIFKSHVLVHNLYSALFTHCGSCPSACRALCLGFMLLANLLPLTLKLLDS